MPVGVMRQSAVFTLKVYQAEDLPQSKYLFLYIEALRDSMELFSCTFCSPNSRANPPGKDFFKISFSARAYMWT